MTIYKPIFFLMSLSLLTFPAIIFPQSGRTPAPLPETKAVKPLNDLEKSTFIISNGFDNFLRELNRLGKTGYKIEKSINFGGSGVSQQFAAFLTLDEGNSYQYDWLSSPNKNFVESRLNYKARTGFTFADAFALTVCGEADSKSDTDSSAINSNILDLTKGDVFLLVKKNGVSQQIKEYKVIIGKLGLGKNPTQVLQTELDKVPPGFSPVTILFSKTGLADFAVSILLEKNISNDDSRKIEFKFLKEVNGFEKEVNSLAAQGFRIISGRRIGLIKMALLAKETPDAAAYTIIDEEKYEKEFGKTVELGNVYQGILSGDADCDSQKKVNEKLFFTQTAGAPKYDYKILKLLDAKMSNPTSETSIEIKRLIDENYGVRDLFFYNGVNIIFEK